MLPTPEETDESALLRRLWLNVILRAKEDAEGRDLMYDNAGEARHLQREGRQWLTGDCMLEEWNRWDLEKVCEMAGVRVEELVRISKERYYGVSEGGNS